MPESKANLEVSGLSKRLGTRLLFRDISFQVMPGEKVAITGESGSGKSSLLAILGLLDRQDTGRVTLCGQAVPADDDRLRARLRGEQIGFVFQNFCLLDHLSVIENLAMAAWLRQDPPSSEAIWERARALLKRVALLDRADDAVGPMSGGERQRVAIARALMNRPRLLLADEPTGNLDQASTEAVLALLQSEVEQEALSWVVVSHDSTVVAQTDRAFVLKDQALHAC